MGAIKRLRLRPRGVVRDRPEVDVPPDQWTFSRNMIIRDGVPERTPGLTAFAQPYSTPPIYVHELDASWVYGSDSDVFEWDGTSHTDVTPAVYTPLGEQAISFETLNTIRCMASLGQADGLWYQPGEGQQFIVLPGWTGEAISGALRAFGNFLLALGITGLDDVVRWSDAAPAGAIPATWIPAAGNFAGDAALADTPGGLLDGRAIGRNFLAYKDNSTYIGQSTGDQFVMSWRLKFSQLGALARNCVADIGNEHAVFGDGDVVRTDGQNVRSLVIPQQRRWLYSNLSSEPDAFRSSFIQWDPEARQLWIFFPRGSATVPSDVLMIDRDSGSVMHTELPFDVYSADNGIVPFTFATSPIWTDWNGIAWTDVNQAWRLAPRTPVSQRIVLAAPAVDISGGLYASGGDSAIINPDLSETPINATLERATLDFDEPFLIKHCHRLWPHIEDWNAGDTFRVSVGRQATADDPIEYMQFVDYDPAADSDGVPFDVAGRFLSFKFETFGVNRTWRLPSFDVDISTRGRFG